MTVALITPGTARIACRTSLADWQSAVTEPQTAQLTRAIASGDTEAFASFYRRWFDPMFNMARQCTGRDESFCLDVVQDSMMRVIRSIRSTNDEAQLERWLNAVVKTCALDMLRHERRRWKRERTRQPLVQSSLAADRSPQDDGEHIEWLRSQLSELPADQARLLNLRFRLGWTLTQIGRFVGLKPGAVDGRISRAVAQLQAKAAEEHHREL